MDKKQLKQFLIKTENQGIAALHSKGYSWIKSNFLPHLTLAETVIPNEVELLADCWYLMGDVFDFNGAPLKAITYYQKAIEWDEDIDGAYRELANMYEQIGQYEKALEHINIALEKVQQGNSPLIEDLLETKATIQDSINYQTEPYLTENNQAWQLAELLANEQFDQVINDVLEQENPEVYLLQCLARAYGAQELTSDYIKIWQQIAQSQETFELEYGDWYYMPTEIYDNHEIWQLLKKCSQNIQKSAFIYFDSLYKYYEGDYSSQELFEAICDFQTCLTNNNQEGLKALAQDFPLWEELEEAIEA